MMQGNESNDPEKVAQILQEGVRSALLKHK